MVELNWVKLIGISVQTKAGSDQTTKSI